MEPIQLGKYTLIEPLGRGGYGAVYLANETVLKVQRAVKLLHPALVADPTFIERFRHEAQVAARLEHPHIVPVYELSEDQGRYFLAMKYLPGGSLKDLLEKEGRLHYERALQITKQIASALDFAHQQGLVHRDVKPGNILFEKDGTARLADFGFSKAMHGANSASLSATGGMIGTPQYMAPELWRGKQATSATDVYSLACVLGEMLSGEALFPGESPAEIITLHVIDGAQFPEKWPGDVPADFEDVLRKALQRQPSDRYQSPLEIVNALELLEGKTEAPVRAVADIKTDPTKEVAKPPVHQQGETRKPSIPVDANQAKIAPAQTGQPQREHVLDQDKGKMVYPASHPAASRSREGAVGNKLAHQQTASNPGETHKKPQLTATFLLFGGLGIFLLGIFLLIYLFNPLLFNLASTPEQVFTQVHTVLMTSSPVIITKEIVSTIPGATSTAQTTVTQTLKPTVTKTIKPTVTKTLDLVSVASGNSKATSTLIPPTKPSPSRYWVSPADGMTLVYIPAGEFTMGNDFSVYDDVKPAHKVFLDAYWMDSTEVTNAMFAKFLNQFGEKIEWMPEMHYQDRLIEHTDGNWKAVEQYLSHPVWVSWEGADTYCKWAGRRLPTEAEWEKAARGGIGGARYPWGDEKIICSPGAKNGAMTYECYDVFSWPTVSVHTFAPNGYGLYGMLGNLKEWVADYYDENYYQNSPERNPMGPNSGFQLSRGEYGVYFRIDGWSYEGSVGNGVGFRCAVSPGQ